MTVELTSSGLASPVHNVRNIEIPIVGIPVSGTEVLFACVGMVDGDRPNLLHADFFTTPSISEPMELVSYTVGVGGSSFPAAFIVALRDPSAISGTICVEFDEPVVVMNGIGLLFSGLDSDSGIFKALSAAPINTQRPDFRIEDYLTVSSGSFILDMCVAESSNHTSHVLTSGSLTNKITNTSVSMHRISTAWQVTVSGGPALVERIDCGGPFAGVSLTAVSIGTI